MAEANSLPFVNFQLLLGDGATPTENFVVLAACTTRKHDIKNSTGSTDVPDAENDAAPMTTELETKAITHQISFDGVTNMGVQFTSLRSWADSGAVKNVQVKYNVAAAQGGGVYQGAALMTAFTPASGKKGEKATFSGTLDSSGAWTWTPAAS